MYRTIIISIMIMQCLQTGHITEKDTIIIYTVSLFEVSPTCAWRVKGWICRSAHAKFRRFQSTLHALVAMKLSLWSAFHPFNPISRHFSSETVLLWRKLAKYVHKTPAKTRQEAHSMFQANVSYFPSTGSSLSFALHLHSALLSNFLVSIFRLKSQKLKAYTLLCDQISRKLSQID